MGRTRCTLVGLDQVFKDYRSSIDLRHLSVRATLSSLKSSSSLFLDQIVQEQNIPISETCPSNGDMYETTSGMYETTKED